MIILGLNSFHGDSSAAIVVDGKLIAAVEEERFTRIKHWAGFPALSIKYCLQEAGVELGDVTHIAINQDSSANVLKKLVNTAKFRPEIALIKDRIKNRSKRKGIEALFADAFPGQVIKASIEKIEHHLSHLASAFYVSPYFESSVVSVDGFGDYASAAWGVGRGAELSLERKVFFPHSLGIFYQALTQYLGFPHYGDEYKVMGLAPYGNPVYLDKMREIVKLQTDGEFRLNLDYFRHHKESVNYEWVGGSPSVGTLYSEKLADLLGPERSKSQALEQKHWDIARSIQAMYEEAFFNILNKMHDNHQLPNIAVSGGCGMNSVANGKITLNTPFKNVYVQSAAGDAGGAIGAAMQVWHASGGSRSEPMLHAYLGPAFSDDVVGDLLDSRKEEIAENNCTVELLTTEPELYESVSSAIAGGKVIGWFQGRMEWGPRALGNRSILGDPRRADMKDILNIKIKRRESFRPFAPSVLRDHVAEWFELDGDVPFMMRVFQIKQEQRDKIPAVTHVDGSGRLQTVTEKGNSRYFGLINAFNELTGVPMLLNTSFNENEPVVCTPEEALNCFLRTNMDVLAIGNWIVKR